MAHSLLFTLKKEARKSGGDRYTAKGIENFDVYFPQQISRPQGRPLPVLAVIIGTPEEMKGENDAT